MSHGESWIMNRIYDAIFNEDEFWYIEEEVILMCAWCTDSKESDVVRTVELIKGDVMVPDERVSFVPYLLGYDSLRWQLTAIEGYTHHREQ